MLYEQRLGHLGVIPNLLFANRASQAIVTRAQAVKRKPLFLIAAVATVVVGTGAFIYWRRNRSRRRR